MAICFSCVAYIFPSCIIDNWDFLKHVHGFLLPPPVPASEPVSWAIH